MNKSAIINQTSINGYDVYIWRRRTGELACSVSLIADESFGSSLEYLRYRGELEDGDAVYKVHQSEVVRIIAWAEGKGYVK